MSCTSCSDNKNITTLDNGVNITGTGVMPEDSKVILHFSTRQHPSATSAIIRKARATSQFLYYSETGDMLNHFSINREVLCNSISQLNNSFSICYADFSLNITKSSCSFLDDSTGLDLPTMTIFGPQQTDYLPDKNLSYYLINFGTGPIPGQYTTILRFNGENSSYDVVIPYSICCVSYDEENDRFIYRLRKEIDHYAFGFITFNESSGKYVINEPCGDISRAEMTDRYGDKSGGGIFMIKGDMTYEIIPCQINNQIQKDLNITTIYPEDENWGVLVLQTINLITGDLTVEYLTTQPFQGDVSYGFTLYGSQQMPCSFINGELYIFTRDNKMNIYSPEKGFRQYDISFDFTGATNPRTPFDTESTGGLPLGNGSPLRIENDGSVYSAHIYNDGRIRIHKYNFDKQTFEIYWESNTSVLPYLDKESLQFISFEIVD